MKQKKSTQSWSSGQINWYDPHSGKGSIIGDDGIWYRIHEFSEIQIKKQEALKEKTRVEFELAKDSVHPIIKSVRQNDKVPKPVVTTPQKTKQL
jgi:cold shock CspA family protein